MKYIFEYENSIIDPKYRLLNTVIALGFAEDPARFCNQRRYTDYPGEHYIMIYTDSGSALLTTESGTYRLTEGTAVWLASSQPSTIRKLDESTPWRCCYLIFCGDELHATYLNYYDKTGIIIKDFDQALYRKKFSRLINLFKQDEIDPFRASSLCYIMMMYHCEIANRKKENFYPNTYLKALDFIKTNYDQPICLKAVADAAGISNSQLHRQFLKFAHMTPMKYIRNLRIKHACTLLHSSDKTLNCIANECGFEDERSLIRLFKEEYHMTPGQYRKSVRLR